MEAAERGGLPFNLPDLLRAQGDPGSAEARAGSCGEMLRALA